MEYLIAKNANLFFISCSDNPDLVLIAHPLTDDNYESWCCVMIMSLFRKNKLGFVDDSNIPLAKDDPQFLLWHRNSSIVNPQFNLQ